MGGTVPVRVNPCPWSAIREIAPGFDGFQYDLGMGYELVWFKRDLRWHDHAALAHAARLGPVRCIYVVEPGLWREPDAALQHFEFVRESLQALDAELKRRGGRLEIHTGECPEVLERIWQAAPFDRLHSHEETGNGYTYARDLRVQAWCKDRGVSWLEQRQFGVVRRLKNRNHWQGFYEEHMVLPQEELGAIRFWRPETRWEVCSPSSLLAPAGLWHNPVRRQKGGRDVALATLRSFLHGRSLGYRGGMSSPLTAPDEIGRAHV